MVPWRVMGLSGKRRRPGFRVRACAVAWGIYLALLPGFSQAEAKGLDSLFNWVAFYAPCMLPRASRLLYLDTDVIVRGDVVTELYDLPIGVGHPARFSDDPEIQHRVLVENERRFYSNCNKYYNKIIQSKYFIYF